jgi:hypothetical protein
MRKRDSRNLYDCECEGGGGNKKMLNANQIQPTLNHGWVIVRKHPIDVKALKMPHDFVVQTLEGKMFGKKDDYLVIGTHGERYIIRKEIFETTYQVIREFSKIDK